MKTNFRKIAEKVGIIVALAAVAVLVFLLTHKEKYVPGEFVYTETSDGYITVDGYTGESATLIVPSEIDGFTVNCIGSNAFAYKNTLEKIILPETVKKIDKNAFYGSKKLETVVFPESLEEIGEEAFADCRKLRSAELPKSLLKIGDAAFENCTNLKNLYIPKGCKSIGADAFMGCENLVLDCKDNDVAREVAEKYNIPTDFSESSDAVMIKVVIFTVVLALVVFLVYVFIKRRSLRRKKSE
ncbi:MAG: leucine-rich repeat domain-containing protein [Clostridia bacterium]|nr:leucine-rich repeat domain-containing protein [Clostridia bacterium]MBQ9749415.1 leucine-rich repeat domain-containing protein [Clostridia bacterium]